MKIKTQTLLALCIFLPSIDSHGTMVAPTPRQPESMYWYQVGCVIGCTCSGGGKESYPTLESVDCPNPAEPTLDTTAEVLTWNIGNTSPSSRGDWNAYMPWRAPGTSKPLDSCGIASGFAVDAAVQFPNAFVNPYVTQGMKGTDLAYDYKLETVWVAGSVVEAAFRLVVNHGGGYQYRVCRKERNNDSGGMTEDCFERNPLAFADAFHTVRFNVDATDPLKENISRASVTLNAVDVTEGVQPAGHAWRRLPIPACACDLGDGCYENSSSDGTKAYVTPNAAAYGHCDTGLQFEAEHLGKDGVWPEGYGYYVETLGDDGGRSEDAKDACNGMKSEEACVTFSGCLWYASADKSVCYEGTKDASEIECESHDQTACATHDDVCEWADTKSLCYSKTQDTKDANTKAKPEGFDGGGTIVDHEANQYDWIIVDKLIAPSEVGRYILQWRWDNEQTPQIWTTCSDIKVVEKKGPETDSSAQAARWMGSSIAGIVALTVSFWL
mmetsp:Transcript_793/g.931  ORF Transcript_793/g.931 Transcript_793/m.931 type:complete len:497 (-) Transcript_793:165-1655(-)